MDIHNKYKYINKIEIMLKRHENTLNLEEGFYTHTLTNRHRQNVQSREQIEEAKDRVHLDTVLDTIDFHPVTK